MVGVLKAKMLDGTWVPIGPGAAVAATASQNFPFPASVTLPIGGFNAINIGAGTGSDLMERVSIPRLPGWIGANPVMSLRFKATGLYVIQGDLILTVNTPSGSTYIAATTATGSPSPAASVTGLQSAYGPTFYDGNAWYRQTVIVNALDVHLQFAILVTPATSTWSSPGGVEVLRLR